ncbi:MFS transporter [Paenibacillus koleovorans]|uniref:MFS transporter n=1 Tax=Paenibacillus koleovorans TaxID=121608 RepID=UPI000FDACBDA|nr:MFS transporter [Paenibacillus koleovorans]
MRTKDRPAARSRWGTLGQRPEEDGGYFQNRDRSDDRDGDRQTADWKDEGRKEPAKQGKGARLNRQAWLLLLVNGLFAAANALSGTFVNVYLWKVKNDFAMIGWFAFSHQITMAFTFWLAGKWVKEGNKMNALRLGVVSSALFYLFVLFLERAAADWIVALGIVQGLASGFFWLAFNVVYFEITDPDNRDRFNGWAGLLGSGAGMIAPWVSGFVISQLPGNAGYRWIFGVSLAVFVLGAVVSFFLKKRKVEGTYDWLLGFRTLRVRGPWRPVFAALVAQGMREGVFGFIIGLLIYIATQNEMHIGNFSLITSALALVSFFVVGRFIKPGYRKRGMLVGAAVMIGVILPFFWKLNYSTLLIFGIGTALFIPLYVIPMTSSVFDLIGKDEESAKQRVEYVVIRELGLNVGRMLGTLTFILVVTWTHSSPMAINWLLLGIGSSPLLAWWFMRGRLAPVHRKEIR